MDYIEEFEQLYCDCENTAISYITTIKQYLGWCQDTRGWNIEDVVELADKRSSIQFLNHLLNDKELSPYSVNQKHTAMTTFFRYLCELDYRVLNPFENIRRANTKMIERKAEYITYEEYEQLINAINRKTNGVKHFDFVSARDTLMITTMFTCGLRISEVLNMRYKDIDMKTKTIKIIGKGSKLRRVPVTSTMERALDIYEKVRGYHTESDLVFISIYGNQMDRKDTNKNIAKYCKRASIDKDITNHSLRHSCISYLLSQNVPIVYVKELAGHANLASTSIYSHAQDEDIWEYVEQAHNVGYSGMV